MRDFIQENAEGQGEEKKNEPEDVFKTATEGGLKKQGKGDAKILTKKQRKA